MINDNKLNGLVPFQNDQPTASISIQDSKDVKPPSPSPSTSKVSDLPFPKTSVPESDTKGHFTTKRAQISDSLLREIDRILSAQAEQIETEFKELEEQANDKELVEAILGIEGLGYGILNYSNIGAQSGVEFLGKVLPRSILDQMPPAQKWEELGNIASLGATLISALDTGAQGVAIICKHKILHRSKEFLTEFKANFAKQIKVEQAAVKSGELEESVLKTPKNIKIQNAIDEWELQIAIEEKALKEEKFQFGLNATSQALTLVTTPLSYIPKELVLQHLYIVTAGIGLTVSGIEILGTAVELKEARKNNKTFNKWMKSYQNWQDKHLPKFEITEKGAKRIRFTPRQPVILSKNEHKNALFASIKANPFSFAVTKLKECGIDLPPTIAKKKDLLSYLDSNPDLVKKYIHFQRQLEYLNTIIYTSENLLEKRKAIVDKKVLFLKSRFNSIHPQIREEKKQAFTDDIQRVKEALKNPQCPLDQVEELLSKWGILKSNISVPHAQLITAFEGFKNVKLQKTEKTTSLDIAQAHLLKEFDAWTNQTDVVDNHFEDWFLRDYIDHQETIEHTTKNALKQMVQQKHELENRFQKFKLTKSTVLFAIAAVSLTVSVVFAILGLVSLPFAGAGTVLLALSITSATLSLGFLGAGYLQSSYYKPHTSKQITFLFQMKMSWVKLRTAISTYSHQSKEKKLIEVAKILQKLHQRTKKSNKLTNPDYQKALADYQKAKFNFKNSQEKVDYWTKKLKRFEFQINEAGWKDFSQYANLPIADKKDPFDTLNAFQTAFQSCDLRLLSTETRTLLEMQLGISLENLQKQIEKDPQGIKKALQEFFALGDAGLIDFIKSQKARIKKGLLKPQLG